MFTRAVRLKRFPTTTIRELRMLLERVEKAIDELKATFPGASLEIEEDGSGGARIRIDSVDLSPIYSQRVTWIGGHIAAQIPYADVYPLFVRGDLLRTDSRPLGEAMSPGHTFMAHPAVQVSRRSNARDPIIETPALKFLKVLAWINNRS
jgi:hypothetical protein